MNLSLRTKFIVITALATAVPVALLIAVNLWEGQRLNHTLDAELGQAVEAQLGGVVHGMYALLQTQQESLDEMLRHTLNVVRNELHRAGGLRFQGETVEWSAVNQLSGAATPVRLPRVSAGGVWLGQNDDPAIPVPVVDDATKLVAGTVTIFQRMNDAGDMLRVATTVVNAQGRRAVGTYIPARGADGTTSPIVATVLGGHAYRGRALVVDAWQQAVYEPILENGAVVGMLYAGVKQESVPSLRKALEAVRVGDSGRAFVLGGTGAQRGQFVLGDDRDRASLGQERAPNGEPVLPRIVEGALALEGGRVAVHRFHSRGGTDRILAVTYFAPWDWVVGVAADASEFRGPQERTARAVFTMIIAALVVGAVAGNGMLLLAIGFARAITRPLRRGVRVLEAVAVGDLSQRMDNHGRDEIGRMAVALNQAVSGMSATLREVHTAAQETTAASGELSDSALRLADGARSQAAMLEQTAASLEEITGTVKQNADNARHASELAVGSREGADQGRRVVEGAVGAMGQINESSHRIARIITSIDEIAFQTNLLALNAAVEAARAGEQGRGFAVVASEVRNLAQRAATSAREIGGLIRDSVEKVDAGTDLVNRSGETLERIVSDFKRVTDLVGAIATASREQAAGIDQMTQAVAQMDQVVQSSSSQTDALSVTARTLAERAERLEGLVARFKLDGHHGAASTADDRTPGVAVEVERADLASTRARATGRQDGAHQATVTVPARPRPAAGDPDRGGFEEF
jgi:methyl-accepting chemotaxis protein